MSDISQSSIEHLEAEKIAARQRLLKLAPHEAQNQVNQTLHAELWQVEIDAPWVDRLPRTNDPNAELLCDGCTDA